jgi:P27 family predicted phage terminase small subunit
VGKRGPAPTPTRLLALRGSWRAKVNPAEPRPEVARPDAPAWLSETARAAFDLLADQLHSVQLLTRLDENALVRYADLWASYRRCSEFIAKHGDVYVVRAKPTTEGEEGRAIGFKTYPQSRRMTALAAELLRLEREFGLTPAARSRLTSQVEAAEDPAESYFGGRTGTR